MYMLRFLHFLLFRTPLGTFALVCGLVTLVDIHVGYFEAVGSPLWPASVTTGEIAGFITAALTALLFYKRFSIKLPWLCAGAVAMILAVNACIQGSPFDSSKSLPVNVYSSVHAITPYYGPFRDSQKDYSLSDDIPEFTQLQDLFITWFVAGGIVEIWYHTIVWLLQRRYKDIPIIRKLLT